MRYLRYSMVFILFITCFISTETTEAASGDTYEVSSMLLHVRDEPANNATIIGLLHKGDNVTVFQEKYGWVQTYYSGQVVWIAKHHLIQTSSATQTSPATTNSSNKQITISEVSVNVRSGPGLDYAVIAGTEAGDSFTVIDSTGDWLKITLANGEPGWIASWLTSAATKETSSNNDNSASTNLQSVSQAVTKQATNRSLTGYNIVLDAGHGGRDPGAIGLEGVLEKDLVATTTSQIANTLRAYGATVIETRTGDYFLSLDERANLSNQYQTHAFISVHFNSFPITSAQGINTFHISDSGQELAANVHASLTSALPLNDRGLSQADYKVLRNTSAPSILMELGFITNTYDLSVIRSAEYPGQVAEAVANGLMNYFH